MASVTAELISSGTKKSELSPMNTITGQSSNADVYKYLQQYATSSNDTWNNILSAITNLGNNIASYNLKANELSAASAQQAMQNSNEQAQKQMDFQAAQQLLQQQYNTAEAQKNREFQQTLYNDAKTYNTTEAQKNRDWQSEMSNTAYQRAVQDMIKAGINPILAYTQGGASIGSGSTASISSPSGSQANSSSAQNGAMGQSFTYQAQTSQMAEKIQVLGMIMSGVGTIMSNVTSKGVLSNANNMITNINNMASEISTTLKNIKK